MAMFDLASIASLISALTALGAMIMSARNAKKIQEVHVSINSRMDQMLRMQGDASEAKGLQQGRDEVRPGEEPPVKVEIVKIPPITPP